MLEIQKVTGKSQIQTINQLAWEILLPFYAPHIADEQIRFFLNKFQSEEAIEKQIAHDFTYFLFYYQSSPVGYLGIQELEKELVLSKLYVLEKFRGKGIGAKAMEIVDDLAIRKNYESIWLYVNKHNEEAIRFYERCGFRIITLVTHHYENGHSVQDYKMEKIL